MSKVLDKAIKMCDSVSYREIWNYAKMLADARYNNQYIIENVEKKFGKLTSAQLEALNEDLEDY